MGATPRSLDVVVKRRLVEITSSVFLDTLLLASANKRSGRRGSLADISFVDFKASESNKILKSSLNTCITLQVERLVGIDAPLWTAALLVGDDDSAMWLLRAMTNGGYLL